MEDWTIDLRPKKRKGKIKPLDINNFKAAAYFKATAYDTEGKEIILPKSTKPNGYFVHMIDAQGNMHHIEQESNPEQILPSVENMVSDLLGGFKIKKEGLDG